MKIHRVQYPGPARWEIPRRLSIYPDYSQLHDYISAKSTEQLLLQLMQKADWQGIIKRGLLAKEELVCQTEVNGHHWRELASHLRAFTTPFVLVRCLGHVVEAYEKKRDYERAVEELVWLVSTEGTSPKPIY